MRARHGTDTSCGYRHHDNFFHRKCDSDEVFIKGFLLRYEDSKKEISQMECSDHEINFEVYFYILQDKIILTVVHRDIFLTFVFFYCNTFS